jgi:hypothetical protein
LVGENRFPQVTLSNGGLVSETPQPTNEIAVRPGDVLGYFVSSSVATSGQTEGIQMDPDSINNVVFFADLTGDTGPEACPVSVGSMGTLTSSINAAPVISVDIGKLIGFYNHMRTSFHGIFQTNTYALLRSP